jgi:hypothetical protein
MSQHEHRDSTSDGVLVTIEMSPDPSQSGHHTSTEPGVLGDRTLSTHADSTSAHNEPPLGWLAPKENQADSLTQTQASGQPSSAQSLEHAPPSSQRKRLSLQRKCEKQEFSQGSEGTATPRPGSPRALPTLSHVAQQSEAADEQCPVCGRVFMDSETLPARVQHVNKCLDTPKEHMITHQQQTSVV